MRFPRVLTVSVVIAAVTAICTAARGQAATPAPLPYRSVAAGVVAKVHPSPSPGVGAGATVQQSKGARRLPTAGARTATKGAVVSDAASAAATGRLLENFNGVSSRDSEVTNFNARFEPPDQGLCAGNGFVLEPVNSAYSIYTTIGTAPARPVQRQRPVQRGRRGVHVRPAVLLRRDDQHVVRDHPVPQRLVHPGASGRRGQHLRRSDRPVAAVPDRHHGARRKRLPLLR